MERTSWLSVFWCTPEAVLPTDWWTERAKEVPWVVIDRPYLEAKGSEDVVLVGGSKSLHFILPRDKHRSLEVSEAFAVGI
jgi:hypothetical protein